MRSTGLDRSLLFVVVCLAGYGVLMVYSAGQTDVPSVARGAWVRQLVWLGLGVAAGAAIFRVNFRILEWAAPWIYALGLALLALTLVIGSGAGSAASSKSWLAIGGHRIGQPVELAKLATILLLARYLSSLREAPRALPPPLQPPLPVRAPPPLALSLLAARGPADPSPALQALPPGRSPVPARHGPARPGQRHRLHRDPLRDAVLGRGGAAAPGDARLPRREPPPRRGHPLVGRLDAPPLRAAAGLRGGGGGGGLER